MKSTVANRKIRVLKLSEQGNEAELKQTTTPAERWEMMWQLALDAWAFKGASIAESRFPRHTVRVLRSTK